MMRQATMILLLTKVQNLDGFLIIARKLPCFRLANHEGVLGGVALRRSFLCCGFLFYKDCRCAAAFFVVKSNGWEDQ